MKKLILISLVTILSISASIASNKTATVTGTVFENTNDQAKPLSMAYVYVDNTVYCTYTKADGSFELDLPKGTYEIKIAFKGFEPVSKTLEVKNAKPVSMQLNLTPEAGNLANK